MWDQGNAAEYATWIDEGLNVILREVARRAHPRRYDHRVLQAFLLCALLGLHPYLGQDEDPEADP